MAVRPVHWHEGMFLRPQHLQAAERFRQHFANLSEKWDCHYNWGLRIAEIDLDALANHRFVIRALAARMRDGTLIQIPEEAELPALDLKPPLEGESEVTVFLAVPVMRQGRPNAAASGGARDEGARYLIDTQELEDENTGQNPQEVQVRLLNLRLLVGGEDQAGYQVLPIARVTKSARAEALPELDAAYIPPLLACDAWKPLSHGILQSIYDQIGKHIEQRAGLVTTRGIGFDAQAQGDRLLFEQLRVLNEAYAYLGIAAFAQGIHPLIAYMELCRVVGQLAIFGDSRRPPDLPKYDHDDLGYIFTQVKNHLQALLGERPIAEYKERPFIGQGLRMQVALETEWLHPNQQMFIGVQSTMSNDECVKLLTKAGHLDMKIGSSARVDDIFRLGQRGLIFTPSLSPPRVLPQSPQLTYFQIDRNSQQQEWSNVSKELSLAIRVNENLIAGNIQGQRVLTIRTGGKTTTLQFTLFVVPQER